VLGRGLSVTLREDGSDERIKGLGVPADEVADGNVHAS
jgi:hypothetical protein